MNNALLSSDATYHRSKPSNEKHRETVQLQACETEMEASDDNANAR